MAVKEASRRVLRAEQKLLRVQRRLWLAQLALYPTAALGVVGALVVAWRLWQRRSAHHQAETSQPYPAGDTVPPAAGQLSDRTT
ncbi:hypothetical protein A5725_10525 [Mycobacterium kubicae]|uniref:hypothetical protein n=1 Tax=Mycobacterium kubicae TaxID=120959 RepID=UPI0008005150|nr:hypothetical protein [Mycobacterium kubicae]OBF22666.1 hypothetical protein A5725_10525 [Mycobacterium kubicae]